jgi:3-oxoadipate enol-lactonase
VFLHPFPADRTFWAPQLGALVDHSRCIAPDLRGFGETTCAAPFTMDQYADDVAGLLDVLGVERAVLCGLSMGGYVALALWRRHRRRVRALVLADTRGGADTDEARAKRRALAAVAREKGASAVADAQIGSLVGASTQERSPQAVDALHHMLETAPVDGIVGALEAMMARADSLPLLPTIDVPTLVLVGAEDVLTPEAEARRLQEGIPGSRLEVIAGAGHASSFERPAAFNRLVSEFLASLVLQ